MGLNEYPPSIIDHLCGKFAGAKRHFRAVILAVTCVVAVSVARPGQAPKNPAAKAPTVLATLSATKGSVEQGTYKNPSIGLEFTPADNLRLGDSEMKGTPGAAKLLITIEAKDDGLLSGLTSSKSLTIFYAESLAYYPENQRNTSRYVPKVIRANQGYGYQIVNEGAPERLSGYSFTRVDCVMGKVYEADLISTHNGYAFVFIFAGRDLETVNKLIATTKVKITELQSANP